MSSKTQNYILSILTIIVLGFILMIVVARNVYDVEVIVGLILLIPSVICLLIARSQLSSSFAFTPQAKELVTHGLYSKIRNPIYVFITIAQLAVIFCLKVHYFILLWLPLVAMEIIRAKKEAQVLEEKFGDVYREYNKGTWF